MSWALPARCETTAKSLEAKATLMGATLKVNAEPDAPPAEAPPAEAAPPPAEPPAPSSEQVDTLLRPAESAPPAPAEAPPPNPQ
jgi:hypothetical protein